jgi:formamidopyrimidine-DNA glycosylase
VLYHAKIHPEQYSNTLNDSQVSQLCSSIHYVCSTSCDLLGDADQFPTDWLFKHRWNKGKKNTPQTLPNGEKIVFLTVGGRTSAVVPSVQKKTGPVAKDVNKEDLDEDSNGGEKKSIGGKRKRAAAVKEESDPEDMEDEAPSKKPAPKKRGSKAKKEETEDEKVAPKKTKATAGKPAKKAADPPKVAPAGRRRSTRLTK